MTGLAIHAGFASRGLSTATLSLAIALAACSPANDAPTAASMVPSATADVIGCANDPRADAYRANLSKVGTGKSLTFVLVAASPAPPAINNNTWTLQVLDSNGSPIPNATFSPIKTWMPDHGHGSPEVPLATPNPDGTYSVQPLDLFMNGLWQVTFTAQVGTVSDSATFSFCVGG